MTTATRELGIIDARQAYTRGQFMRMVGMTRSSFSAAVKDGLRICAIGKRTHVRGVAWLDYLARKEGSGR
jgi:hypothetical protein